MPTIDGNLTTQDGALVSVGIYLSAPRMVALQQAGQNLPQPFLGLGLIDTGASSTVIDGSIVRSLGLVPTGSTPVHTPSTNAATPKICNCYDASIWFFSQNPSSARPASQAQLIHPSHVLLPVIEANLAHQGFHVLIGRDILEHCHLSYDGKNKKFTVTFGP